MGVGVSIDRDDIYLLEPSRLPFVSRRRERDLILLLQLVQAENDDLIRRYTCVHGHIYTGTTGTNWALARCARCGKPRDAGACAGYFLSMYGDALRELGES